MTDPTPTRAEVETFRPDAIIPSSDTVILPKSQFKRWCENYQASLRAMEARHFAEEAALRERAEAAEAECARLKNIRSAIAEGYNAEAVALEKAVSETLTAQLTAARRAEAAAWNDAIEAFTAMVTSFERDWSMKWRDQMIQEARALRRAATTEGEA